MRLHLIWLALWLLPAVTIAQLSSDAGQDVCDNRQLPAVSAQQEQPPDADWPMELGFDRRFCVNAWLGYKTIRQEGTLRIDRTGSHGSKLKLQETLGLPRGEESEIGGFMFHFLLGQNLLLYTGVDICDIDSRGSAGVRENLRIGNHDFLAGDTLESRLHYRWYRAYLGYIAFPATTWGFGFYFCGEYAILDYRIASANAGNPDEVKGDIEVFLPLTGIRFDLYPYERWHFTIASHRCYTELFRRNVWVININAAVTYSLSPSSYLFVRGEWEFADYKVKAEHRVTVDVDIYNSWVFGGGLALRF